jgi:steroid delta-isomerase-like uncharacterized protein
VRSHGKPSHVANLWYLSGDELGQRAEADRRDVDPPIGGGIVCVDCLRAMDASGSK